MAERTPGTDWNDYMIAHGQINTGHALKTALERERQKPATDSAVPALSLAKAPGDVPHQTPPAATPTWARFELRENPSDGAPGVYWIGHRYVEGKRRELPPLFICSPLQVLAVTRDMHGRAWGRLLSFKDLDGNPKKWVMPARLLAGGRGDELRASLLEAGLPVIKTSAAESARLLEYLMNSTPPERARSVDRAGWHQASTGEHVFVASSGAFGAAQGEQFYLAAETAEPIFQQAGTLADWRAGVAQPAGDHRRLIFTISCAFAGPLVELAGGESGGFHISANSTQGKTTSALLAASVWGSPRYIRSWRSTSNALESVASDFCDSLLVLDDIGQAVESDLAQAAYLLGNGMVKSRANRDGSGRASKFFRVLLLSTGEVGTSALINAAGKKSRAGNEIRLVELPADAGQGHGVFDSNGAHESTQKLAKALTDAARRHYGTAGAAFLTRVAANRAQIATESRKAIENFLENNCPANCDGQVLRVASRFALVSYAGELASEWGLTGWDFKKVEPAILAAFDAWLQRRGTSGAQEPAAMVAQVRRFIQEHGSSRYAALKTESSHGMSGPGETIDHEVRTIFRAGYRDKQPANTFYLTFSEVFKNEICNGYDYRDVCRALLAAKCLVRQESGGDRYTIKARLPHSDTPATMFKLDGNALLSAD